MSPYSVPTRIPRAARRGTALVASLIVVMVVATLGATLIQVSNAITRRQMTVIDTKRAFYVSEAGISEAFLAIHQGKSGNIAAPDEPAVFGDGVYWVEAETDPTGRITLRSTGLVGRGRFSLSVVVERQINPVATLGIFSDEDLVVGEDTIVDGYDSSLGAFESQLDTSYSFDTTGAGAVLTSNQDVILEGSLLPLPLVGSPTGTRIFGDSSPGPRCVTSIGSGAVVTGATAPRRERYQAGEVELPPNSTTDTIDHGGRSPVVLTGPDVGYASITIQSGSTLVLQGPATVVVQSIELADGAQLEIDGSNGPVRLFVTESLNFASGSNVSSVTRDPRDFSTFVTSANWFRDGPQMFELMPPGSEPDPVSPVHIQADGEYCGYLYAPYSRVVLPSSLRFFGAVAALELDVEPGARISFDAALASADINQLGLPQLISWRIVDLPPQPIVKSGLGPNTYLQQQGVTPVPSSDAAIEGFVKVVYRDLSGQVQEYTGDKGSMDWSQVTQVVTQKWSTTLGGL